MYDFTNTLQQKQLSVEREQGALSREQGKRELRERRELGEQALLAKLAEKIPDSRLLTSYK
ncbi:hypothetical protein B7486_43125 [cyanobacterium TDX16]|nr:hypothetical protein B7486_43125 [cyanobacterium TDX16]